LIVAECRQAFKLQVATLQLPLVVLLEQQRSDQARDAGFVREDAYDVGPALDLGVQAFERVGAVNLQPMRLGEVQAGGRSIEKRHELGYGQDPCLAVLADLAHAALVSGDEVIRLRRLGDSE